MLPGAYVSNAKSGSQAIAFVFENDLYYKPKVQNDLVCRITTTGKGFSHINYRPFSLSTILFQATKESSTTVYLIGCIEMFQSWKPTPLHSPPMPRTYPICHSTIASSTNTSLCCTNPSCCTQIKISVSIDLSRYSWLDNSKYPKIKSIRYPKEGTNNPNVTVFVVDLSVLKFINKIAIMPPANWNGNNSYVGNMIWLSPIDLSITFTNREQTSALTVVCRAPTFNCTEVRNCFHFVEILFTLLLFDGIWVSKRWKFISSYNHTVGIHSWINLSF